jgi:Mor family transcriptional regulator
MEYVNIVYNKYFIYFLGFLWSDGFIERKRVGVEILEDDAIEILEDIKKIDFLKICTMNRHRENRRPQMTIYFCDVKFYDFFISKYFLNKSTKSPLDLINDMPNDLVRYFYLGLIDGDGCFYFNLKNKNRQFYVTSSYEQDWTHIESLFKSLNISQYEIRRVISNNGNKSSYIRIKKYSEIESLYNYLYPCGYEMGLKRKYNKCLEIINNPPIRSSNKAKIDLNELILKINENLNIVELSKIYDCNWRKIYNLCKKYDVSYPKGFFSGIV